MVKVFNPLLILLRKLKLSRSGFTLVELLVVIGIIAILAGVALGPITGGIKKAQQSKGLQTAHVISLAEFQYANDNNQQYPDSGLPGANGGAETASSVVNCLLNEGYVSDPTIFYISSSSETKFSGALIAGSNDIPQADISWDFCGSSIGTGVNPNAPDQLPLVWSCIGTSADGTLSLTSSSSNGITITVPSTTPFGENGVAVCYKSNSSSFITANPNTGITTQPFIPAGYPGWANAVVLPGGG